jgi:hypothetical protein
MAETTTSSNGHSSCCPPNAWGALLDDDPSNGQLTQGNVINLGPDGLNAYTVGPKNGGAKKVMIVVGDM